MSESPTLKRCDWAGSDPDMVAYHDTEWGVPVHEDIKHFEFLVLEGAQSGLSWSTILKRRGATEKPSPGSTPPRWRASRRPGWRSCCWTRASSGTGPRSSPPCATPAFLGSTEGVRLLRHLHLGFRGRADPGQQVASNGAAAPGQRPVGGLQCRSAPPGLRLRRADHVLRPPPGGRAGERPPGRLFPLPRAHRLRAIRTWTPKRDMTGSSGGRSWARRNSSTGRRSTKPSEA